MLVLLILENLCILADLGLISQFQLIDSEVHFLHSLVVAEPRRERLRLRAATR